MKTKLFNFIIIGTLLMTGVVSVQVEAFSTPVHTGGYEQKKEGSFVASFLKAGLKVLPANVPSLAGFIIADKVISSPQGFFNTVILPVNKKGSKTIEPKLLIGAISNVNEVLENRAPVTVKLAGRGEGDISRGRDAVALLADPTVCTPNVSVISTNTSAFHFWSDTNTTPSGSSPQDSADIVARQIQLSGGSPGAGKVLISVDSQGTATWATVRVDANGVATYSYSTSPVSNGLCEGQVIPGCMNPLATNYNSAANQDDGSCKFITLGCMDRNSLTYNPNATENNPSECEYGIWKTGDWSTCQLPAGVSGKVGFFDPVPKIGNKNESCSAFIQRISGAKQTRSVVCTDKDGKTVADSFCKTPKPINEQPCTPRVSTTIAQYADSSSHTFGGINISGYNASTLPRSFNDTCAYALQYTGGEPLWSNATNVNQIYGTTRPPNISDWYTKGNSYSGVAGSRTNYQMPACVLMSTGASVPAEPTVANGRKASYYPVTRCYRLDTSGPGGEWDTYPYDMYLNWIP